MFFVFTFPIPTTADQATVPPPTQEEKRTLTEEEDDDDEVMKELPPVNMRIFFLCKPTCTWYLLFHLLIKLFVPFVLAAVNKMQPNSLHIHLAQRITEKDAEKIAELHRIFPKLPKDAFSEFFF